jgi:hypothetical protein
MSAIVHLGSNGARSSLGEGLELLAAVMPLAAGKPRHDAHATKQIRTVEVRPDEQPDLA